MKPRTALLIAWALFGLIAGIFVIYGAFAQENRYVICEGDVCGMTRETWDWLLAEFGRLGKLVGRECL